MRLILCQPRYLSRAKFSCKIIKNCIWIISRHGWYFQLKSSFLEDNDKFIIPLWRHQMETFSALPAICAGNSPGSGEFPAQRPVTRSFDVFFDLRPNKQLSKQWWGWWFETLSKPLWRLCTCNDMRHRGWCCSGDARSQCISSHGIDLNLPENFDFIPEGLIHMWVVIYINLTLLVLRQQYSTRDGCS